jgi:ketosteroid isomerase-like protein
MSENLDLVRSIFAAWERGAFGSVGWADPDIEWVLADGPSRGTWKGLTELATGFRDFLSAWGELRGVADEYREVDAERVLVLTHVIGRGKASGLDVGDMRTRGATVFRIVDGKVIELLIYADRDRALADLGLAG